MERYIKSPLNYIGGKYKLLSQIIPYFPDEINTFIDLFSGGANVGINVNANLVVFNDINNKINGLFRWLQNQNSTDVINQIYSLINQYQLSKTNKQGFLRLRNNYNQYPTPLKLYVLVSYSFNYQFRFNNEMKFNGSFGKNRSKFTKSMKSRLINFMKRLNDMNATFVDYYFNQLKISKLSDKSFIYADPPYLITDGSYNDGNRGFVNWTVKQEKQLYKLLDTLTEHRIKFALSNVMRHKGNQNLMLYDWSKKYNVHYLNYDYKNASYNTKHLSSNEVLITNY